MYGPHHGEEPLSSEWIVWGDGDIDDVSMTMVYDQWSRTILEVQL